MISRGTKLLVVSYLCALFQSTSFEEKVWGRGWKKFCRLSAQSFLQFHVWHNRLGRTRRKFEQRRNYCKFWRELFGKKMRGPVHSSDKKSNGEASFMDSQCVSACRALDVPRRELERRHLCRFIALAAPSSCNTRLHMLHVSKSRNNNNNSCCTLLQVTKLHMLHISNGNNNDSNRFLSRLKPQKEQQQQVYAPLHRIQQAIQNFNWQCKGFKLLPGRSSLSRTAHFLKDNNETDDTWSQMY